MSIKRPRGRATATTRRPSRFTTDFGTTVGNKRREAAATTITRANRKKTFLGFPITEEEGVCACVHHMSCAAYNWREKNEPKQQPQKFRFSFVFFRSSFLFPRVFFFFCSSSLFLFVSHLYHHINRSLEIFPFPRPSANFNFLHVHLESFKSIFKYFQENAPSQILLPVFFPFLLWSS